MLLNQLFEATKASAAFAFGRFNPPHKGHVAVWETVAKSGGEWFIGTNPGTSGPKDPLPYDVKTAWMTAIDPNVKGHIMPETSVLTLAVSIYKQLGERQGLTIAYITDDQDWAWSGKLLNDYNGKEATHGYYNFAKIIHVPSPRVSSATALRDAARAGDMDAFYAAAGTDPNLEVGGKHYYDTVVDYLGQHPEKVKKVKKVAEPAVEYQDRMAGVGMGNYVVDKSTTEDAAGVGVIASKKQAKDPRYLMSLTKDVRPGQVEKNLKAFKLADETMLPKSAFAGADHNKLGTAGQLRNQKRGARAGDLVGEQLEEMDRRGFLKAAGVGLASAATGGLIYNVAKKGAEEDKKFRYYVTDPKDIKHYEDLQSNYNMYVSLSTTNKAYAIMSTHAAAELDNFVKQMQKKYNFSLKDVKEANQRLDPKCWKGYKKSGTKMKGGTRVNNCVKIGESYENKIASLIEQLKKK